MAQFGEGLPDWDVTAPIERYDSEFPALPRAYKESDTPEFNTPNLMVTFKIGKGTNVKTFIVHKEVACAASSVFSAAFNGGFIEGRTSKYCLEDVSESAFRFLVQWMYTKHIKFLRNREPQYANNIQEKTLHRIRFREEDLALVQLWILGDRLLMGRLQNYVIEGFVERGGSVNRNCWTYLYQNTSKDSPLRSLVATQVAWRFYPDNYELEAEDMPHDMLVDLLSVYSAAVPGHRREKNARNIEANEYFVSED